MGTRMTWLARSWAASGEQPHGFVAIHRPGYRTPERHEITRLKRCMGASADPVQRLNKSADRERSR
jgi:hypothetical protein